MGTRGFELIEVEGMWRGILVVCVILLCKRLEAGDAPE